MSHTRDIDGQTGDPRSKTAGADISSIEARDLLVDLLYGELPADAERAAEARVRESLGDELDAMRDLRALMRDLPDEEPPAAISARLLHVAAEAAPARAAAQDGEERGVWAWLRRMFQPLVLHPGLAAAASLVVVVGVVGLMYTRGGDGISPGVRAPSSETAPASPEALDLSKERPNLGHDNAEGLAPAAAATPSRDPADVDVPQERGEAEPAEEAYGSAGGEAQAPKSGAFAGDGAPQAVSKRKARRPAADPAPGKTVARPDSGARTKAPVVKLQDGFGEALDDIAPPPPAPSPLQTTTTGTVGRSSRGAGAVSVQVKGEEPQPKDLESDKADAAKPAPRKPARAEKRDQSEASSRDRESAQTESLHTRAIDAAKRGDCAMVRKLGEQLRKRDRAYFDGTFRRDKRLAKCYAK